MVKQELKKKVEKGKNWKHVEFYQPINESFISNTKEFFIKGVAINETTTRNGITYISEELEKAAPSFRNKPVLKDHDNSIESIVGRTTENVHFETDINGSGRIMFEAQIMDKKMQEMIKDGRITNVSIGTMLEDLEEDEEAGTVTAIGMEGLEISLVAVPGDAGAGLTQALHESLKLKKKEIISTKLHTEEDMAKEMDAIKLDVPVTEASEAEAPEAPAETNEAEEKLKIAEAKIAEYKAKEAKEEFKKEVAKEVKKQLENLPDPVDESPAEDEKPEAEAEPEAKDETEGTVGAEESEEEAAEEGLKFERAESGKGFAMYREYTGEGARNLKRLVRD